MSEAPTPQGVTQLLVEGQNGSQKALDQLIPLVYEELRANCRPLSVARIAEPYAAEHRARARGVFQVDRPAARAVAEPRAFLRPIAAQMMRRHPRRSRPAISTARSAAVRRRKLSLDEAIAQAEPEADVDLLALDGALTALAEIDPRGARIIELRFFSALTIDETAEVLDISAGTVKRDWSAARAWLYRR